MASEVLATMRRGAVPASDAGTEQTFTDNLGVLMPQKEVV